MSYEVWKDVCFHHDMIFPELDIGDQAMYNWGQMMWCLVLIKYCYVSHKSSSVNLTLCKILVKTICMIVKLFMSRRVILEIVEIVCRAVTKYLVWNCEIACMKLGRTFL